MNVFELHRQLIADYAAYVGSAAPVSPAASRTAASPAPSAPSARSAPQQPLPATADGDSVFRQAVLKRSLAALTEAGSLSDRELAHRLVRLDSRISKRSSTACSLRRALQR